MGPSLKITHEEKRALWYQVDELKNMKKEVRAVIRKRKRLDSCSSKVEDCSEFTGARENIFDSERRKRKYLTRQIILQAQKTMKSSDLALISIKLSRWATDRAIEDARIITQTNFLP